MRFSYTPFKTQTPVISLGGRSSRPRPVVCVGVVGPVNANPVDAVIDSGSDETLFDESVALSIGIDLTNAPACPCGSILDQIVTARFANVTLRMTDGIEFREWPAWVGFVPNLRRSVLGFGGFQQFFTTTLYGDDEIVELVVNRLYPGI